MEALPWFWIWVILAAILFIFEMLSLSLYLLPFAVGALVAAICNAIGLELVWQVVVFIVASVVCLIAMRPLAKRLTRKGADVKVGAERLVGLKGKVVEGGTKAGEFRVVVEGEPWNALTHDGTTLLPDALIEVLEVRSNTLLVKERSNE